MTPNEREWHDTRFDILFGMLLILAGLCLTVQDDFDRVMKPAVKLAGCVILARAAWRSSQWTPDREAP